MHRLGSKSTIHLYCGLMIAISLIVTDFAPGSRLSFIVSTDAASRAQQAYVLRAGDTITVNVLGQSELSGKYRLDNTGSVVFPLVGLVNAKNLTTQEFGRRLTTKLSNDYLNQPTVFVQIDEFRPVLVLGDVISPGSYAYQPNSIVKTVIAQAGGFGRSRRQSTGQEMVDFLQAVERLRSLKSRKNRLLVRQARLEAQLDGRHSFASPIETSKPEIAKIFEHESRTLSHLLKQREQQISLLQKQSLQIKTEGRALAGQIESQKTTIVLVQRQLDKKQTLARTGLTRSSSIIELKLALASRQSGVWGLQANLSQLQTRKSELSIRIRETRASITSAALTQLQVLRAQLRDIEVSIPIAKHLHNAYRQRIGGLLDKAPPHRLSIIRPRETEVVTIPATGTTRLEPGDILEVKFQRPQLNGLNIGPDIQKP